MRVAASIKGTDGAYLKAFEMLPHSSLRELARRIVPRVSLSSSPRVLRREIKDYVNRNYKQGSRVVGLTQLITGTIPNTSLALALSEPRNESDLKPLIRRAIKAKGFSVYESEVPIPPATRADVVGYKPRKRTQVTRRWPVTRKPRETITKRWYEFVGFELKTAKRGKEPLDRQVSVYSKYFDDSFVVVTPLTLLEHGHEYFRFLQEELKSKGIGLILANRSEIVGTIIPSRTTTVALSNRRLLAKKMRLRSLKESKAHHSLL